MRVSRSRFFRAFGGVVVLAAAVLAVNSTTASTPATSSVTVPTTAGSTVRDQPDWGGTAQAGANPTSNCSPPSASPVDEHDVSVTVAPGTYDTIDAAFRFNISWQPVVNATANDLILTVIGPDGEVGSSDGGNPSETVAATNLRTGIYKFLVCGFANSAPQDYTGMLEITTSARSAETSLPSAPAQGLAFSASVASDNQRDQSEPMVEIDKAGNIYDCGPTGFSNASDYAQVSTDHGDQFHMLGTPPRGQQGAGGGGDCGLATGVTKNGQGNYQYAYTGLGPLTGFVTSTSPNNGHSIATGGPFGNGNTDEGGGADRQWMTFLDDHTVLLSYNQQVPRNVVVQRSTDGGLTYGVDAALAARNPRFPGPMRYDAAHNIAFFAWDRGGPDGEHVNLSISRDGGLTWTDCLAAVAPATGTLFPTADSDSAGNIYVAYGEALKFHTYMVSLPAAKVIDCDQSVTATAGLPTKNPGFSAPVQVDRDAVRTTVFPWLVAGGAPGRVAVVFAGTETDGNPNSGNFKASWDIYVNQSLNALDAGATFSQVKATTHPFHYDSICLNGLGCDLAVPPGDRSMADFISIDFNPADGRLFATFNRANKKPDESSGHVASPMVVTQIAGPSNGGGSVTARPAPLRTSSTDATGDALSSYSLLGVGVPPPAPPTTNEPAADFTSVSIGPSIDLLDGSPLNDGGFTVTLKVADLSTSSLLATASRTGSQSLLWILRFTNGYQDVAAGARWNPTGFTFGYNDYTTGGTPCESPAGSGEKCILYPGDTPIQGDANQSTGTIRFTVPGFVLHALSGSTGPGARPSEVPGTVGSRYYDATAFSLGNTVSPIQDVQSFLYTLDNTPSMDFLTPSPSGGGGGGFAGCKVTGGGVIPGSGGDGKFTLTAHATVPAAGKVAYKDTSTDFRSTEITSVTCTSAKTATITGAGVNGNDHVAFKVDVVDNGDSGTTDTFSLTLTPGGNRSGTLKKGNIQVHA
jgi:hypothetical protein